MTEFIVGQLLNNRLLSQFVKFSCVGLIATAIQYIILIVLVTFFIVDAVMASTIGFIGSSIVNYWLNSRFTFNYIGKNISAILKFVCIVTIGLFINSISMYILIHIGDIQYLLSQIVTTIFVLCWNFTMNRIWVFFPEKKLKKEAIID